jgi:ABC-type nitrate/sulfonate/bicarbonate transport system ATPase subunit
LGAGKGCGLDTKAMIETVTYAKTLLTIDHVCLNYGDKVILRDVNAEVKEILRNSSKGQVVGFLGPSGIGKTQLFRIIAGLNKPTSGSVRLNGTDKQVHPGEVGVVAQSYPLFAHRSVVSNLMLAIKQKESNEQNAHSKVIDYLEEFDLEDKKDLYPAQLSGGQKQRVAIIQQILCSDHFLLMDEPFSGLDMVMLEKTAELIQKVANLDELNTIILVTHDITTAASVSDHLWLLGRERDGKGNVIPGARIMETYDLVKAGLCWEPGIITQPSFMAFVAEVKNRFRSL